MEAQMPEQIEKFKELINATSQNIDLTIQAGPDKWYAWCNDPGVEYVAQKIGTEEGRAFGTSSEMADYLKEQGKGQVEFLEAKAKQPEVSFGQEDIREKISGLVGSLKERDQMDFVTGKNPALQVEKVDQIYFVKDRTAADTMMEPGDTPYQFAGSVKHTSEYLTSVYAEKAIDQDRWQYPLDNKNTLKDAIREAEGLPPSDMKPQAFSETVDKFRFTPENGQLEFAVKGAPGVQSVHLEKTAFMSQNTRDLVLEAASNPPIVQQRQFDMGMSM